MEEGREGEGMGRNRKRGGREKVWEEKGRLEGGRRYGKKKEEGREGEGMGRKREGEGMGRKRKRVRREKFRRKVKNGGAKRKRVGWRETTGDRVMIGGELCVGEGSKRLAVNNINLF